MKNYSPNNPLISVCMAAYNASEYIEKALLSILNQTYENIEVIIVNDKSTDETESIIKVFKKQDDRIKIFNNSENIGYLRTFNLALSCSSGEYICFVDADDWIAPTKIQKQLEQFLLNPLLGIVGTSIYRTDKYTKVVGVERYPLSSTDIVNYLNTNEDVCMCGSSVMISKRVKNEIGGYREFFENCPAEDFDWIRRICDKFESLNIHEPLYYYRFADNSLTRKVHYSVKARNASRIAHFLSLQRKNSQLDSLDNPSCDELDTFIKKLEHQQSNNLSELFYSTSIQHSINGNIVHSLKDLMLSIKNGLNILSSIKLFFLVLVIIIVPNNFLLVLKNFFGFKSVHKKK